MSAAYKPVGWTRNKLVYDAFLLAGIVLYISLYLNLGPMLSPAMRAVDMPILKMRAFGSLSFLLLTIILAIGPLARLDSRFLPLLYNRRHFGVITALVAASHAGFVLDWYFAFSPTPKLTALFTSNIAYDRIAGFPFELFGVVALLILAVLAVTSHDFWLSFLTPLLWKALHMSVYAAYGFVILHVGLGTLSSAGNGMTALVTVASLTVLSTLHVLAGRREMARDAGAMPPAQLKGHFIAGDLSDIAEGRATIGQAPNGERIAVFRSKGRLFALSNVCSHQNGPVGEGKVVLGFVTCPWHGYQYRGEDGCSPPPYRERIRKYPVALAGTTVLVDPVAVPLGTRIAPLVIPPELLDRPEGSAS